MSGVGDAISSRNANWTFGDGVAENFDSHVRKSVPLYDEGHRLICMLSDYFVKSDSVVYEIGCSTGALTARLARHNQDKLKARFIGIDVEPEMIVKADQRRDDEGLHNTSFVTDDALLHDLEPADLIVAYYTIQFIRPSQRQVIFDKIYKSLNWGGAFLLFEKVRGPDARFQDIATGVYHDYKLDQGYSPTEIFSKARGLKGVLEPFSTDGNKDLLARAGFVDVMSVMKYICFEGFLAIK